MKSKNKREKLTQEEKQKRLEEKKKKVEQKRLNKIKREYFNSIENIFLFSGFTSLPVENQQFKIGNRPNCELDHCFVLKNIIVICEETCGKKDTNHLLRKQETASEILKDSSNKKQFLKFLSTEFSSLIRAEDYGCSRWKIFYLYFSKEKIDFTEEDALRYNHIKFINVGTYNYLVNMSRCIKKSFKYEILRFLNIDYSDFGGVAAGVGNPLPERDVSIIYPNDVTGLNEGVGIVSFMMSPEELIKTSYVLRKDNWEDKIGLYQRLITENRIKSIRKFVIDKKRTFFNNIIVALPSDIKIYKSEQTGQEEIKIADLERYQNCTMRLSEGFNTLGLIDGQHRVYAYFENYQDDVEEAIVKGLRNKLNLLVTGIVFPNEWTEVRKRTFQSEIFLEINKNSKNVDRDILIHIESTKEPFSSMSIARKTLQQMNETEPFKNLFELSLVEKGRIKVASIIQYALSSLVNPKDDVWGLYRYWKPSNGEEKPPSIETEKQLKDYVSYCVRTLNIYFSAIKSCFKRFWDDPKSLILRVVSINGFIISLYHSLKLTDGDRDFQFYREIFSKANFNFSKEQFPYAGSRYSQFAIEMIDPLFYEFCQEKYVEIMKLEINDVLLFKDDDTVKAIYQGDNKFQHEDEILSLYDLTRKIVLNDLNSKIPAGKYWRTETDDSLQARYEKVF